MTKKQHRSLEGRIREYELLDTSDRRCSHPKCPHPDKTSSRKTRKGNKTSDWRSDGKGGWFCNACYLRTYRRNKKKVTKV